MKNFDKLYKITEAVKDRIKKPFAFKKMKRAFEAAIDNLEADKENALAEIDELRIQIANGNFEAAREVLKKKTFSEEADRQIAELKAELAFQLADAEDAEDDED